MRKLTGQRALGHGGRAWPALKPLGQPATNTPAQSLGVFSPMRFRLVMPCAAMLLAATTPAHAADPDPATAATVAETARLKAETERYLAQTAQISAETARMTAQLKAAGLEGTATGATTLGDKAGEMEGWMLASGALRSAAGLIAADARVSAATRVVVLAAAEPFRLDLPATVTREMEHLQADLARATAGPACAPAEVGVAAALPLLPLIGAITGALKTDTMITGFDVTANERLLVNTIAAIGAGKWIIPSELASSPPDRAITTALEKLRDQLQTAIACRGFQPETPEGKAAAAKIDRALAAVTEFETRVVRAGEGVSLIAQATRMMAIAKDDPLVLRVFVEKAGGSMLLRQNLFTALGAPAVGLTGGAVISWRLSDPVTGLARAGGVLVCRTALTNLKAVHRGRPANAANSCDQS